MRKKDTFTKRISCEYNELDTIAEFLEEKAAEGWELTSKTGVVWGFRRAEPRKVKFNVEVVDSDVMGEALHEFIAFCEADGWKHVFDAGAIQIFENEDLDAEPIHTDPEVKLGIVHDKCKAMRIFVPIVVTIVLMAMLWKAYFPLDIYFFESSRMMGNMIIIPLFCIAFFASTIDYLLWYRKAKAAIGRGDEPVYKRSRFSKALAGVMFALIIINGFVVGLLDSVCNEDWGMLKILIGLLVICVVGFWIVFPRVSAKYNKSRSSNTIDYVAAVVILLVVALSLTPMLMQDEEKPLTPPLTLEDLGLCESMDEDPYLRREKSVAMTFYEYDEDFADGNIEEIYYSIYITNWKLVYNTAIKEWTVPKKRDYEIFADPSVLDQRCNFKEVDDPGYHADKVLYNEDYDRWLLLYPDRVVMLDVSEELNNEQMDIVAEKLTADL